MENKKLTSARLMPPLSYHGLCFFRKSSLTFAGNDSWPGTMVVEIAVVIVGDCHR